MTPLNAQLAAVIDGLEAAQRRLRALDQVLSPLEWSTRPAPERWSPLECVAHLNLTALAMLPLIREGIDRARRNGGRAPRRYRRDLAGWLLTAALSRPGRFRTKTAAAFVPTAGRSAPEVLAEFERLQAEQIDCARDSNGLPIHRVKIVSPFNASVRYSVYSALVLLPTHEHRHLWQAEQSRPELSRRA